jgi:TatD DNase family protein
MPRIYDMHSHFYEYSDDEIERILAEDKDIVVVAVSDDVESALRTIEIWERYPERVVPCIGFHPWNLKEGRGALEALEALRLAYRFDVPCIGEVGLDRKADVSLARRAKALNIAS